MKLCTFSITELSQLVEVSDAAIVKFSQRIGYKGYQDLKINLAKSLPQMRADLGEVGDRRYCWRS